MLSPLVIRSEVEESLAILADMIRDAFHLHFTSTVPAAALDMTGV
jgi:hypothetical protein